MKKGIMEKLGRNFDVWSIISKASEGHSDSKFRTLQYEIKQVLDWWSKSIL
jgi:hypothetical protein